MVMPPGCPGAFVVVWCGLPVRCSVGWLADGEEGGVGFDDDDGGGGGIGGVDEVASGSDCDGARGGQDACEDAGDERDACGAVLRHFPWPPAWCFIPFWNDLSLRDLVWWGLWGWQDGSLLVSNTVFDNDFDNVFVYRFLGLPEQTMEM